MKTSLVHSVPESLSRDAGQLLPLRQRSHLTAPLDFRHCAPVSRLLNLRGPAAVSRCIRPVVVDAVQRRSWRRFTHVSKEVFEHAPPLADSDSASPVVREEFRVLVLTSLPHAAPNVMHRRLGFPVAQGRRVVLLVAAARLRPSIHQVCAMAFDNGSAVAPASPDGPAATTASRVFEDGKSLKSLPSEIAQWHGSTSITKARRDACMAVQ